jgi:tRNA(fMet)-specific endonuclease VapC
VDDYLLDANIIRYWFDEGCPQHGSITSRIAALSAEEHLWVSAIALGEIEYGLRCRQEPPAEFEGQLREFIVRRLPIIAPIDRHTVAYYGDLRAAVFKKFAPAKKRRRKWPEELVDPTTGKELGIQENDLWIAAQALEHNFVLVTADKMDHVRKVSTDLRIQNWALPTTMGSV